jgi:hypothetical protein
MSNSLSTLLNTDTSTTSSNILSLETLQQQYNNALVNYQQAYQSLMNVFQNNDYDQNTYIGCYKDCNNGRTMPFIEYNGDNGINVKWNYNTCGQSARQLGYQYFGLQYFNQPGQPAGLGQCTVSNDLTSATSQGPANNCGAPDASGNVLGNYCSNAIYSTKNFNSINEATQNVQYWSDILINLNQQIMDILKNETPYYQDEINTRQSQNTQLMNNLQNLLSEREKVNDYINKYNSFNHEKLETGIVTKQHYFQYILYVVILIIVIVYFFKIVLFPKSQSGGGSSSNTKMRDILFLLGLMLVFLLSGFFFKHHAGFILLLLVLVIFALIKMKIIPTITL